MSEKESNVSDEESRVSEIRSNVADEERKEKGNKGFGNRRTEKGKEQAE